MKAINIRTIRIDGGTQSRVEINNEIVTEYAQALQSGADFPAVVVFNDGVDNWLADGFHRFHAHSQAGKASIAADVRMGTLRDAKLYSFGANGKHGQRPSQADRRKAIDAMLADSEWALWSNSAIAKTCEVHPTTVATRRASLSNLDSEKDTERVYVTKHGTTAVMKTDAIGNPTKISVNGVIRAIPAPPPPPAPVVEPEIEAPPEYTDLDAARDQIEELQAMLAVANLGSADPAERLEASNLIAELRTEVRQMRVNLKAVTTSRDSLMNELTMVKRQCVSLQSQLKKLQPKA